MAKRKQPGAQAPPVVTQEPHPVLLRALTVAAAIATVLLTWPLWQVRDAPPLLPLLPLPALPMGAALIAALLLALVAPRPGWIAYLVVLAYAVLADQTRIQPQFLTFAILLAAALPSAAGVTLARVYLLTLWFYAGLHKLLSAAFIGADLWTLLALPGEGPPRLHALLPWLIGGSEIAVAVLAALPRTRWFGVAGAVLLHGGIFLTLVHAGWNPSVWPWNVLCAGAAILLFVPWTRSLAAEWRAAATPLRVGALALALYPLGFYAGVVDAHLAHALYAANAPQGYVCNRNGQPQPEFPGLGKPITYNHRDGDFSCREIFYNDVVGAPLPPMYRLYADYFVRTCNPSEFLLTIERRPGVPDDLRQQVLYCGLP